jgi:hypothetical protein
MRETAQPGIVPRYHIRLTAGWHILINITPHQDCIMQSRSPKGRDNAGYSGLYHLFDMDHLCISRRQMDRASLVEL